MSEDDLREQFRTMEEAEERRQRAEFSKKEAEKIDERAQTPKPNPLGEEHLRQERNIMESAQPTDREKMLKSYQTMKEKQQGLRNKILATAIGSKIKVHIRTGPKAEGRLTAFDTEMGMLLIEGPSNSKNSIIGVQLKDVARWEVFPD